MSKPFQSEIRGLPEYIALKIEKEGSLSSSCSSFSNVVYGTAKSIAKALESKKKSCL